MNGVVLSKYFHTGRRTTELQSTSVFTLSTKDTLPSPE